MAQYGQNQVCNNNNNNKNNNLYWHNYDGRKGQKFQTLFFQHTEKKV